MKLKLQFRCVLLCLILFTPICKANQNHILYDVNTYPVEKSFIPDDLVAFSDYNIKTTEDSNKEEVLGKKIIMKPLEKLTNLCENETGLNIFIRSGYRSYSLQSIVRKNYGELFSALPGFSEHQLGLAVDIETHRFKTKQFITKDNPVYQCFSKQAYKFGFIQSYPKNNIYNYQEEPWHWRYIGKKASFWLEKNNFLNKPWEIYNSPLYYMNFLSEKDQNKVKRMKEQYQKLQLALIQKKIQKSRVHVKEILKKREITRINRVIKSINKEKELRKTLLIKG